MSAPGGVHETIKTTLDEANKHLTEARKHAKGAQTDACLVDLIGAIQRVERVVQVMVRAWQADPKAIIELSEGKNDGP